MAIAVTVTFDGQKCTYAGPAVVPTGSILEWTLVNTQAAMKSSSGAALVVAPVVDGTTWEQILAYKTKPANDVPDWAVIPGAGPDGLPDWAVIPGAGPDGLDEVQILYPDSAALGSTLLTQMTRNAYYVGCATAPEETNKAYPAILLKVMQG